MSLISEIIERLNAGGTPFKGVAGAVEFAAIEKRPGIAPAAYVMISDEAAGENIRATGGVLQELATDITIVLVAENLGDQHMAATAMDIETLKDWSRGQLIGFEPEAADDVLTLVSGKLLKARSGTVWWEEIYAATQYLKGSS